MNHYNKGLVGHVLALIPNQLFPFGKFLKPIYLHVLLSKGKELIMNDLSIMFPQLVKARASKQ